MDAGEAWLKQGSPRVRGPATISVALRAPDRRARDAGNLHKCLLDCLVKLGVIEDDSNRIVVAEVWRWAPSGLPCLVTIRPAAHGMPALEADDLALPAQERLL